MQPHSPCARRAFLASVFAAACVSAPPLRAQLLREGPEPNAAGSPPAILPCGAQVEGTIHSADDADAYPITLTAPTFLAAWTGPAPGAPIAATWLELTDAIGRPLRAAGPVGPRAPFAALEASLLPGSYRLVVRGANGALGTYALDTRASTAPPLVTEEPEPNDSPAAGGRPTIATVDALAEGVLGAPGDTDWYSVVPHAPLLLAASVAPGFAASPAVPAVRVWAPGPTGPVLVASASGAVHTELTVAIGPAGAWVEVAALHGGTGTYLLTLRARAASGDRADGCLGSAGRPSLDVARDAHGAALELPVLGATFVVDGSGAPNGAAVVRLVGLHGPLPPASLAPHGGGDCALGVDPFGADFALADATGSHRLALRLPSDPRLRGQPFVVQAAVLDPAANALGVALSGAFAATCGTAL